MSEYDCLLWVAPVRQWIQLPTSTEKSTLADGTSSHDLKVCPKNGKFVSQTAFYIKDPDNYIRVLNNEYCIAEDTFSNDYRGYQTDGNPGQAQCST